MSVSAAVGKALQEGKKGDSTGCGDNFAGGVIGSLARQKTLSDFPLQGENKDTKLSATSPYKREDERGPFDLIEACRWGIVSGGFACFYYGGTYLEQKVGEKLSHLQELYDQYLEQERSLS